MISIIELPFAISSGIVDEKLRGLFGHRYVGNGLSGFLVEFRLVDDISPADLDAARQVLLRQDILDSWDPSKLREVSLVQLNNEITTRQNEINACTTLAQAKTALLNLLVDDAKAWRIILWLLKREMNELE